MTLVGERLIETADCYTIAPGEIIERNVRQVRTEDGLRYEKRRVVVGDAGDRHEANGLNLTLDMWNQFLEDHKDEFPIPLRKNGYQKNPAYEWFYGFEQPEFEGTMEEWLTLVPSARALYPMQMLEDMERVFPSGKVSERTRNILTNSIDAIAIRARAAIMKSIVKKTAGKFSEENLTLVSLGAGAAVPAINAVLEIEASLGKKVSLHLFDQDEDILTFAEGSTVRAGIPEDRVHTYPGDYYNAFDLPPESVHMLEALGLFEYLPDSRCETLIEKAYTLLKPGGVFVFSNMLDDRPQLGVNQRAVAWPGVKVRTEEQLMQMVAKCPDIDMSMVTYTVSDDGVYGVVEIHKP